MKKLFVALGLVMGGLHVSYAEPASAQQVPGYYKHQFGNYASPLYLMAPFI
jgi:hypothetical protein